MMDNIHSLLAKARDEIAKGNITVAVQTLTDILKQDCNNVDAWLLLADALENAQHRIESLKRALKVSPDNFLAKKRLDELLGHGKSTAAGVKSGAATVPVVRTEPKSKTKRIVWIVIGFLTLSIICLFSLLLFSETLDHPSSAISDEDRTIAFVQNTDLCFPASYIQEYSIKDNFQYVDSDIDIGPAKAVRATWLTAVEAYFIAAKIVTQGAEDGIGPGVWFVVGPKDAPENIFSVNWYAKTYSSWPSGDEPQLLRYRLHDPSFTVTMDDGGAIEAFECASEITVKPEVQTVIPTDILVPTLFPTPTPLSTGSLIVISDSDANPWQVRVTKILVADSLKPTFSNSVEKAAGRFAIIFMEVTNRGLSPGTFVAFGILNVMDASGQRYEENYIASFYAQDIYSTDICANINPDETKSCVSVFDVSRQNINYFLVPGILADPNAPSVLLDVP